MKLKNLIVPILIFISGCTQSINDDVHSFTGQTMGTTFSVKFTSESPINIVQIENEINSLLERINLQMSTYLPNSELSLFNKSRSKDWFSVSSDLAFVVDAAQHISEFSQGKFDVTIGPIVNLWGFGPNNKPRKVPSDNEINKLRRFVGYRNIDVRLNPPSASVYLLFPSLYKVCEVTPTITVQTPWI